MTALIIRGVDVGGRGLDVRVAGTRVAEMGTGIGWERGDEVLDGRGRTLVPGLHDHHLHLLAMAAARRSVVVGPPAVRDRAGLVGALRRHAAGLAPGAWIRGVGYHESVAGPLTRSDLDGIVADRPVRLQDTTGSLWILNSRALDAVGLASASGRLFRADERLRTATDGEPPPLAPVGALLASYGVTGVTDATPCTDLGSMELLRRAASDGALPQSVTVTGAVELVDAAPAEPLHRGPVKYLVSDHLLPSPDEVAGVIARAHRSRRPVAIHCVTAAALAVALAAWGDAGPLAGDRIEHGAVITPEAAAVVAELGLCVVTQPGFIAERGDRYLRDVPAVDVPHLYRCGTLLDRGVAVGGSTDAPYGDADPWRAVAAAVDRRTAAGLVLGPGERVPGPRALDLFLTAPEDPGGPPRRVAPGAPADLCLLEGTRREVLADPSADRVVATVIAGRVVHRR